MGYFGYNPCDFDGAASERAALSAEFARKARYEAAGICHPAEK